jgi:hypothetical protein
VPASLCSWCAALGINSVEETDKGVFYTVWRLTKNYIKVRARIGRRKFSLMTDKNAESVVAAEGENRTKLQFERAE